MSAKIIHFPSPHHVAAKSLNPNKDESIRRRRPSAHASKIRKYSAGMTPDARQLDTAEAPTPKSLATAPVPPNASMIASTDLSIPQNNSNYLKMSSLQRHRMDFIASECFDFSMDSKEVVGNRVDIFLESTALTAREIAEYLGVGDPSISNWRTGKNLLPVHYAVALCEKYRLTLDWLYRGDDLGLPADLRTKIKNEIARRRALLRA